MNEKVEKFDDDNLSGGCLQSDSIRSEKLRNNNLQKFSSKTKAEHYMQLAIEQARKAAEIGEVPIGAVVVQNFVGNEPHIAASNEQNSSRGNEPHIIAAAHNLKETTNNPAGHAEFLALQEAARKLDRWRLSDCTVFVTLEPCLMCAGLMHQARIERCVYGANDPKAGALGALYNVANDNRLNHNFDVQAGVMQKECAHLLKEFFRQRRK